MFNVEVLTDAGDIKDCFSLGELHYEEVEKEFSGLPYQVNMDLLEGMISASLISCVAAFDEEVLIGYVCSSIVPDLISDSVKAQEIGMYVKEEYRGEGVFKSLLDKAEEEFSKRGVYESLIMFKEGYEHKIPKGYVKTETVYRKRLG